MGGALTGFTGQADAQTMAEMGHIEIVNERGTFGCSTRLFKQRDTKFAWMASNVDCAGGGCTVRVMEECPGFIRSFINTGGAPLLCLVPPSEEVVSAIPDFRDVQGSYIYDPVGGAACHLGATCAELGGTNVGSVLLAGTAAVHFTRPLNIP